MDHEKSNLYELLKIFRSFSGLSQSELVRVVNFSTVREYRKGMAVFYQGNKTEGIYFILSGRISLIKYRADETSVILSKLEKGKWIGIAEGIIDGPCLTDALVEEKSELLYIQKSNLIRLLELPGFGKMMLDAISLDYYSVHANLEDNSPLQKIIRYLKAYVRTFKDAKINEGGMIIEITQDDLAAAIGFTRETVNKYLNDLQKKNIISLSRGKIEVVDIAFLEQLE